jgi:hypothetical protein
MASDGGRLDAVADELYGLPLSEFTAARDRAATAARRAGDRELAGEIKKLRRPTVGAWLTNQLVRQHGDEVDALLRLGSALRDAQAELATDDLRRLSQQAQQVVTALGREARRLATDAGQRAADGPVREVEETLHAALADPAAGVAVRAGRLTSPLSYAGFGSVDVPGGASAPSTALGASSASAASAAGPAGTGAPVSRRSRRADGAAARAEAEAQAQAEVAREAQAELEDARRDAGERERRLDEARQDRDRADQRVEELSEELEGARRLAREAATATRDAERAYRDAERRLARAQAAVDGHGEG